MDFNIETRMIISAVNKNRNIIIYVHNTKGSKNVPKLDRKSKVTILIWGKMIKLHLL